MGYGRILTAAVLGSALLLMPALAQTPAPAAAPAVDAITQKKLDDAKKKEAVELETQARNNAAKLQGYFRPAILAGSTINDFRIDQPTNRLSDVTVAVVWASLSGLNLCPNPLPKVEDASAGPMSPVKGEATKTTIGIPIPSPPCWWPLRQDAKITVTASVEGMKERQTLFNSTMPVSGFWFPFLVTMVVLAFIYPGSAAAAWFVSKRQYEKKVRDAKPNQNIGEPPQFWASLDPVELTKNPYGRGSISKLQIFVFSFIVFALLLFNVLRTGLLANMSTDVLFLMGISAFGAAGGKIAYVANRRLSLDNWAWLRRMGWLEPNKDVAPRAKWSELFVDSNTKEFDPYRFQMAIFSLVVAIALISVSATGLEAFAIPAEMLGLLGISQAVFIGGQALENGGYNELDKKLTDTLKLEKNYNQLKVDAATAKEAAVKAAAAAGTVAAKTDKEAAAEAEFVKYRDAVAQAAEMFGAIYSEQLGESQPESLKNARRGIVPPG